jgi:hypothetical protein
MEENKLAGQVILEHDSQQNTLDADIIEYRRAIEPSIINTIRDTANQAKDKDAYKGKDFYIVLITTNDRVLRHPKITCLARKSCPTPVYKQSVWKYRSFTGDLDFLWSIPDAILYYHIINNQTKYLNDKETSDLAKFVILMESGELLEWVKKENGEKIDAVIRITKEENA